MLRIRNRCALVLWRRFLRHGTARPLSCDPQQEDDDSKDHREHDEDGEVWRRREQREVVRDVHELGARVGPQDHVGVRRRHGPTVIVSDRASLPEVCGEAAVYCDPDDPADIARQLRLVLTSSALRRELREAGLARARSFGWQRSADQLTELLALETLPVAA